MINSIENSAREIAGVSSQVYVGSRPWHGGGFQLPQGVSCVDAIASDPLLGSEIEACPVMIGAPDGSFLDWPTQRAHVRVVDNAIVGRGSERYALMQHRQLAEFCDQIAQNNDGVQFEIAGLLRQGSQFVMQARISEPLEIGKLPDGRPDTVTGFLTVSTSHDGARPTEIGFATMRAECANMTAMAIAQVRKGKDSKHGVRYWSIPHVGDQTDKLRKVSAALATGRKTLDAFVEFARRAADTAMTLDQFDAFALQLLPDVDEGNNAQRINRRSDWRGLFQSGIGNNGSTAWDAYNAITEWTNYKLSVRGDNERESRIYSTLFDRGATLAVEAEVELRQFVYTLDA